MSTTDAIPDISTPKYMLDSLTYILMYCRHLTGKSVGVRITLVYKFCAERQ